MKYLVILFAVLGVYNAQAQVFTDPSDTLPPWKRGGLFNLTFSNTGLNNWQGGGLSSTSLNTMLKYEVIYTSPMYNWMNHLELNYGIARLGEDEAPFRKSNDQITFLSKAGRQLVNDFNLSLLADLRTQFAPGYFYFTDTLGFEQQQLISDFFAPAHLISALGVEYMPSDSFYIFISPTTIRSTFVLNEELRNEGLFGLDPGQTVRHEFGAHFNARYMREVLQNTIFETHLRLFSGYEDITRVNVDWQNILRFNVNRYITTLISTHLLFDPDVEILQEDGSYEQNVVQFKHVLNLGLKYEF